jgi:hypothetical protein
VVLRFEVVLGGSLREAPAGLTPWVPILFFVLGGLIIALSTWEFFPVRRAIGREALVAHGWLRDALIVTTLVFMLAVSVVFIITSP